MEGLKQIGRIRIVSPEDGYLSAGITSFVVEGTKPKDLWLALLKRDIVTRSVGPVGDPEKAVLRICTHIFNTEEELEQTLNALREILD
jgi:selenocysteine lyase/cysteine desulfurase